MAFQIDLGSPQGQDNITISNPWNFKLTWSAHKISMISQFPLPWTFRLTWGVHKGDMISKVPPVGHRQATGTGRPTGHPAELLAWQPAATKKVYTPIAVSPVGPDRDYVYAARVWLRSISNFLASPQWMEWPNRWRSQDDFAGLHRAGPVECRTAP